MIKAEIKDAVWKKAEERNSTIYIKDYQKYLDDISSSKDIRSIWNAYKSEKILLVALNIQ
ncbi:hypothetical protein [Sedimentibacter sp. MB31-C6]|uniref:hypothetical protein n=1 Tax=Sedimentibacter sp. MB31-C6 TaxID=3109366 RepID=UPI002DDCDACF|nr:hypothetical protein [Sedimentibacter sp. MB36-C1]WSI02855.1 hypothetical protein U8307_07310 [Sedimentibacter sp. MB36-C1]